MLWMLGKRDDAGRSLLMQRRGWRDGFWYNPVYLVDRYGILLVDYLEEAISGRRLGRMTVMAQRRVGRGLHVSCSRYGLEH